MKIFTDNLVAIKYCGIISKQYGYKNYNLDDEHIRFKGIKKSEVLSTKFNDQIECMFEGKKNEHNFKLIKLKQFIKLRKVQILMVVKDIT